MIRLANVEDAHLFHQIMMVAFEEYRHIGVPSSALNETVNSIEGKLRNGSEKALLYFTDEVPLGCAWFTMNENTLYFSRLAVCLEARGRGIAKSMLLWLENYAKTYGATEIRCRVRISIPQNIQLYKSVCCIVCKEEVVTNANGFPVETVVMKKNLFN